MTRNCSLPLACFKGALNHVPNLPLLQKEKTTGADIVSALGDEKKKAHSLLLEASVTYLRWSGNKDGGDLPYAEDDEREG